MSKYPFKKLLITTIFLTLFTTGCTLEQLIPLPAPPVSEPSPPSQETETDTQPPEIRITSSIMRSAESNHVTFRWIGFDNETPSSQLVYSTFLKDYDRDYSLFYSDVSRTYVDVPVGTYTFYVKAQDMDGNIGLAINTIEITPTMETPEGSFIETPVASSLVTLPHSEVSQIAASKYGSVVYALDAVNSKLYKSEHAGYGWKDISNSITGTTPWNAFAIAPDNHNVVAIVTNAASEVYLSMDGGTSFSPTELATKMSFGEKIKCISISPSYGNNNFEIAVGTSTNNGNGKIWINIIGTFTGTWKDISTDTAGWTRASPAISGVDVFAIKYSPSFASDGTLLAITSSGPTSDKGATYLYMGIRDLTTNLTTWNGLAGYPVEICEPGADTPGTPLTYASIAIPIDFTSSATGQRNLYVCWTNHLPGDSFTGNDDVYRLQDNVFYRLRVQPDFICSLAHYGTFERGKLLAGAMKSSSIPQGETGVQVYYARNPQSISPNWQRSQKPPTGMNNAQVAWSPDGDTAYCGTSTIGGASFDQSAFSRSTDNGITWNQIGLIDD